MLFQQLMQCPEVADCTREQLQQIIRGIVFYCCNQDARQLQTTLRQIRGPVKYKCLADVKRIIDYSMYTITFPAAILDRYYGTHIFYGGKNHPSDRDISIALESLTELDIPILIHSLDADVVDNSTIAYIQKTAKQAARYLRFIVKYDPSETMDSVVSMLIIEGLRVHQRYARTKTGLELKNYVVRSIWNASKQFIDQNTSPGKERIRKSGDSGREFETVVMSWNELQRMDRVSDDFGG